MRNSGLKCDSRLTYHNGECGGKTNSTSLKELSSNFNIIQHQPWITKPCFVSAGPGWCGFSWSQTTIIQWSVTTRIGPCYRWVFMIKWCLTTAEEKSSHSGCSGQRLSSLTPSWPTVVSELAEDQFQTSLSASKQRFNLKNSGFGWLLVIFVECRIKFNLTTLKTLEA